MRDGRLGPLRQNDGDGIAATHTKCRERVGQAIRLLLQVPEGECRRRPHLVFPIHREAGAIDSMAAAYRRRNVELGRHLPTVLREDLSVAIWQHQLAESEG